jgi:hypothetical protein
MTELEQYAANLSRKLHELFCPQKEHESHYNPRVNKFIVDALLKIRDEEMESLRKQIKVETGAYLVAFEGREQAWIQLENILAEFGSNTEENDISSVDNFVHQRMSFARLMIGNNTEDVPNPDVINETKKRVYEKAQKEMEAYIQGKIYGGPNPEPGFIRDDE